MTIKELSKNALGELEQICDTMKIAADNSENVAWKFYNQGKVDGVKMTLNMMSDVIDDDDDHIDSRDPAHIFTECKVGSIHFTLQVNESNVNAVVGTLIDNKYRVVVKNITDVGDTWTRWTIEYWKE